MPFSLIPDLVLNNYRQVTPALLEKMGIRTVDHPDRTRLELMLHFSAASEPWALPLKLLQYACC